MLAATDTDYAPWTIVPSDDKRRARLNCIGHLLSKILYQAIPRETIELPRRDKTNAHDDLAPLASRRHVPEKTKRKASSLVIARNLLARLKVTARLVPAESYIRQWPDFFPSVVFSSFRRAHRNR
jgi:hypothetical protein